MDELTLYIYVIITNKNTQSIATYSNCNSNVKNNLKPYLVHKKLKLLSHSLTYRLISMPSQ